MHQIHTKKEVYLGLFKYPGFVKVLKMKKSKVNENAPVMSPNQSEHFSLWTI
jgi:hypothetical protein